MLKVTIDIPGNKSALRELERELSSEEFKRMLSWMIAIAPSAIKVKVEVENERCTDN